ncbi:MAG: c-type cytochrome [Planctomycetota bacterium]
MSGLRAFLLVGFMMVLFLGAAGGASLLAHEGEWSLAALSRWTDGAIRPRGARFQVSAQGPEELILRYGCLNCHVVDGAGGHVGPILNGVRARKTREEILVWLTDPQAIKPGTPMPDFGLNETEKRALADYLLKK